MHANKTIKVSILFSIGMLVNRFGSLFFRFFAIVELSDDDYVTFSVWLNTFFIFVYIFGFGLNIPLTRKLRIIELAQNEIEQKEYLRNTEISNYLQTYFVTFIIGSILFLIYNEAFVIIDNIWVSLLTIIGLAAWTLWELLIAISRGKDQILKANIWNASPGLIRIGLVLMLILFSKDSLLSIMVVWILSFAIIMFPGLISLFQSNKISLGNFSITKVKNNLFDAFYVLLTNIFSNGVIWVIVVIAALNFHSFDFKLLDLALIFISLLNVLTVNLSSAILQYYSTDNINSRQLELKKQHKQLLLLLLTLTFLVFLFTNLYNFEMVFIQYIFTQKASPGILISFQIFIFVPFFMILSAIFKGFLLARGDYRKIAILNIYTLVPIILSIVFIFVHNLFFYLPIILIINHLFFIIGYLITKVSANNMLM